MTNSIYNKHLNFMINSGISSFLQDEPNNFYQIKNKKNDLAVNRRIEDINEINDLEIFIKKSTVCALKQNANKTVLGDGNINSQIMFIGEAPGADEDSIGKPFVGAAGQLLNKMLIAINLKRENIFITNIIPWRPPNNRTPSNEEVIQCLPFIQKYIEIIKPKIIILLGATAAKAILSTPLSVSKLRSSWHEYKSINLLKPISCIVTYHPSFLLRSPNYKKQAWEDLKILQKKINNENL